MLIGSSQLLAWRDRAARCSQTWHFSTAPDLIFWLAGGREVFLRCCAPPPHQQAAWLSMGSSNCPRHCCGLNTTVCLDRCHSAPCSQPVLPPAVPLRGPHLQLVQLLVQGLPLSTPASCPSPNVPLLSPQILPEPALKAQGVCTACLWLCRCVQMGSWVHSFYGK